MKIEKNYDIYQFWASGPAKPMGPIIEPTVPVEPAVNSTVDFSKLFLVEKPTGAVKHDDGKPDWSLVPFESLEGMVKVLEFGAKKYDNWNWTADGGFQYTRVLRSCLRHLFAWSRGEDLDPESGLSHIHHAMCNLLFISHYIGNKKKYNKDDRNVR